MQADASSGRTLQRPDGQQNTAVLRCIFDGIRQEIEQDLTDAKLVSEKFILL